MDLAEDPGVGQAQAPVQDSGSPVGLPGQEGNHPERLEEEREGSWQEILLEEVSACRQEGSEADRSVGKAGKAYLWRPVVEGSLAHLALGCCRTGVAAYLAYLGTG